jgi:NADH-quinone oxidoreductase subunit H
LPDVSPLVQALVFGFVLAAVFVGVLLTGVAYTTLFERKVISILQVRVGPNRAGPLGLLQPLADGIKLLFKEEIIARTADRFLHRLAPGISMIAAFAAFSVVPVGPVYDVNGWKIPLFMVDLPVAVLYLIGVASLGVYGVVLGGWSSGSKYSLLGALRGAAQLVSYELVLGMSVVGVVLVTGQMSLRGIVEWQMTHRAPLVLILPVSFVLFVIGMFAETNRPPFDLPEAEQELVAGYQTEYSGFRFSMFYMSEYLAMITVSIVCGTLFFGGWGGPFGFLPGPWWLALWLTAFLFLFVWVRATIPRLRYDQLMGFSWGALLPVGLVNVFTTAVCIVGLGDDRIWWTGPITIAVTVVFALFLSSKSQAPGVRAAP